MMPQRTPSRRETYLTMILAPGLGSFVLFFVFVLTGRYFLAVLTVLGGLIVLGLLQFILWGRKMQRKARNNSWPPIR
jgi:hypothetical protein